MSYSWVDPHFAALYARREEERLAERLASRLRELSVSETDVDAIDWRGPGWMEKKDVPLPTHLRLL